MILRPESGRLPFPDLVARCVPSPSPDGNAIAFVRRDKDQSQLWVKDIASGREQMIYGDLDLDVQETWAVTGVYPNMDWTPDSRSIVFWAGGKIRRVNADGSGVSDIPFSVDDTRGIADAPHPVIPVSPDSFTTAIPRFATLSPDGRRIVFETLGKLYVKNAAGGTARRLTNESDALELWPSFSRDGRRMVYVRWTDAGLGEIVVADANGRGGRVVTSQPGHYAQPKFSPDGSTIVFEKREGGYLNSPDFSENPGVYSVPSSGGTPRLIARDTGSPQFGADDDRVFMLGRDSGNLQLISSDMSGEARRVHAQGELANDFIVSPDGNHFAFRQNYEAFTMPLMPGGQAVNVSETGGALPVTKVSEGGADYIGWSRGGDTLYWSMGPTLYRASSASLFADRPKSGDEDSIYAADKRIRPFDDGPRRQTVGRCRPDRRPDPDDGR